MEREDVQKYYEAAKIAEKGGLTNKYLKGRGIKRKAYMDFDYPLKEKPTAEKKCAAIYPLVNKTGDIVAVQRTFVDGDYCKIDKRYFGKKSKGFALLKKRPYMIVTEGLENALSLRQHFGTQWGILVAGDVSNLERLIDESWALDYAQKIIIGADSDPEGQRIAREVYFAYIERATLVIPTVRSDWNSLLVERKITKILEEIYYE